MTDKPKDYYDHYDEMTGILADEETGLLEDEVTGLLNEEGTSLLEEDCQEHYPSLYRVLTEENICINKPVFRIGKEQSYADYFVENNSAVSRSHADVITRGNRCFVIDLNSKNKTFINDSQFLFIRRRRYLTETDCMWQMKNLYFTSKNTGRREKNAIYGNSRYRCRY